MNDHIRIAAKAAGVFLWQIADALGIAESTFIRKLRKEFPPEEQEKILAIIEELTKEVQTRG